MFNKKYLFSIVIASAFIVSTSVNAADGEHSDHDDHHGEMKSNDGHKSHSKCNKTSKMDVDNDGKISLKEFMHHQRKMFDKKDINNDHFIDEDEMAKMIKHKRDHDDKREHKNDDDHGHDH